MTAPGLAPADVDAERAVLGACLLSHAVRRTLVNDTGLTPEDMSVDGHGRVLEAMLAMDAENVPVESLMLSRRLGCEQGPVEELAAFAPATHNIRPMAAHLVTLAGRRRKWKAAHELLAAIDAGDDDQAAEAEGKLGGADRSSEQSTVTAEQLGSRLLDWLGDTGSPAAIPSGFRGLDRYVGGGLRPGDTTAVASWTGWGKSCLVDTIISHTAKAGYRSHAYVNEMSDVDRGLRMLARESGVPYERLAVRKQRTEETAQVVQAASRLPFGLTDCSGWSFAQVSRHLLAARWDVAVLDLIHNMPYRDSSELSSGITMLTAAALRARTHLLVVCQLNEERAKTARLPQPVIRDIRDSGMIKNACANVLLVHREQTERVPGEVELLPAGAIVAGKARHGQTGATVPVTFDHRTMSYREISTMAAAA